jgi:UDP-hydrolysing UDP-N-acetyl-D-glucosamine 2-epimerase
MKKVAYISGSRAEYYVMRRILHSLNKRSDLTIIATCMHLNPLFGSTIKEIVGDGFNIKKVDMLLNDDSLGGMVKSFGRGVSGISKVIEKLMPDLILLEGDRGESLAGAIVGAHFNIPIVHHGGGDVGGSIDNKIRYAITAFSDYHLVGNSDSYNRLVHKGIPSESVFEVGEPGLDDIYAGDFTPKDAIAKKFDLDPAKPLILLVQHPNTEEYEQAGKQIVETLDAIEEMGLRTVAIYSNSDAGGRKINETLEKYKDRLPFLSVYPNVKRRDFLGLMNYCDVMIGNSSAGIIELPSFMKPYVCIGTREKARLRAGNTIDVGYNKEEIVAGIKKALYDKEFKEQLKRIKTPYGDGRASERVVQIVFKILRGDL